MSAWVHISPGEWRHRPWWKVAINTCLRLVQPQSRKWVVFTRTNEQTQPPTALGYGFGRVLHR